MDGGARERLFDALLLELGERGYEGMILEDALARAGVSRAEFDAEFGDKDACLFAAYERLTERLIANTTERCDGGEEWPERIRRGLEALLAELAAEPLMARVLVRAFPAIGPAAQHRYTGFLEAFAPFLREGREFAAGESLPADVEMLAIGAAATIVFDEIAAEQPARLPALLPSILFLMLVPFLGPEQAGDAMRQARDGERP